MEKKVLLLFLFLGMAIAGMAQTKYTSAVWKETGNFSHGLQIRNWTRDYSVAYGGYDPYYFFFLLDHSDFFNTPISPTTPPACSVFRAKLPFLDSTEGFVVKDMCIVDNIAFFCGIYHDRVLLTSKAFWGFFKLSEFFTGTLNVYYYFLQNGVPPSSGQAPVLLDRLVAYNNGGRYDVVAFSRSSTPCSKLIEIQDAMGSAPSCYTYDFPATTVPMCVMYIDDITMDDSHVIVSGHDLHFPPNDYIWYGIYDKSGIAASLINTFVLPASESPNGSVICTNLTGKDAFALSYTFHDEILGTMYTRMRVIQTSSGINIHSQQYAKDDKGEPLQMTYLPDLSSIELVQDQITTSDFVQLYPFSLTGYNASVLNHSQHRFYDIDAVEGHHFITEDSKYFYLQDRTMNVPASTTLCPDDKVFKVEIIDNLTPVRTFCTQLILSSVRYQITAPVTIDPLFIDCFSVE